MKLSELLGDSTWLFDLGFPIRQVEKQIPNPEKLDWHLSGDYAIPPLGTLSGGSGFAVIHFAWTATGLFFQCSVTDANGSNAAADPRQGQRSLHSSLLLDTRWSPGVHRATTFCHRFDFIIKRPSSAEPFLRGHGELNPIQRARAQPADIHPSQIHVATVNQPNGYEIRAYLVGETLTGFSPEEYQDIGVFCTIHDQAIGTHLLARTIQSPYFEDPSVWCRGKLLPVQG